MSRINIAQYQTLVFDCDGVILNSNKIKTQAFYNVASAYGQKSAQALRDYHLLHGGISRYEKFRYLLTDIVCKPVENQELDGLLSNFAKEVRENLLTCEIAKDIDKFRKKTQNSKWLIVSGGDQSELREVFKMRGLDAYFNGGIFGSPDNKKTILKNEIANQNITGKSVLLGDSLYDYEAAESVKMDFIFMSEWTEVLDWKQNFSNNSFKNFSELLA